MNKTRVIYSSTNVDFFSRERREAKCLPRVFVQVSSYAEKKGHFDTLKAFSMFRERHPDKQFRLIFLGNQSLLFEAVVAFAEKLRLRDCVEFVGQQTPAGIRSYLELADVAILHSVTSSNGDQEGIPNALMEAMSMELPVLSSFHAGIPELVKDGIHGYLVKERDLEHYAERINDIYDWPLLGRSRERIREAFSKEQHIEKLLSFYDEIIEHQKAARKGLVALREPRTEKVREVDVNSSQET